MNFGYKTFRYHKKRGKLSYIMHANTPEEVKEKTKALTEKLQKDKKTEKLLAEKKVEVLKELYIGIRVEFSVGKPVIMISSEDGVEIDIIEKIPKK